MKEFKSEKMFLIPGITSLSQSDSGGPREGLFTNRVNHRIDVRGVTYGLKTDAVPFVLLLHQRKSNLVELIQRLPRADVSFA